MNLAASVSFDGASAYGPRLDGAKGIAEAQMRGMLQGIPIRGNGDFHCFSWQPRQTRKIQAARKEMNHTSPMELQAVHLCGDARIGVFLHFAIVGSSLPHLQ